MSLRQFLQNLISPSAPIIRFFLTFPYTLSLRFLQLFYCRNNFQVWARNSYILKTLIPTQSDLDLTIYIKKGKADNTNQQIKKIKSIKKWKFIFPFMGEINVYCENDLHIFHSFFNPYERDRDPLFSYRSHFPKREKTLESKIVFLLKMLQADSKNLISNFKIRQKKWNFHFQTLGIPYNQFTLNSFDNFFDQIYSQFLQKIYPEMNKDILRLLLIFSSKDKLEKEQLFFCLNADEKKQHLLFSPIDWMLFKYKDTRSEDDWDILKLLNFQEQTLIIEHINWEIWGIYSQTHNFKHTLRNEKNDHLERLQFFLQKFFSHHSFDNEKISLFKAINILKEKEV